MHVNPRAHSDVQLQTFGCILIFQAFSLARPTCHADAQHTDAGSDVLLFNRREYLAMMTEEQIDRYEAFRRSSLQKTAMRKVRVAMLPFTLCAEALPSAHMPQGTAANAVTAGKVLT